MRIPILAVVPLLSGVALVQEIRTELRQTEPAHGRRQLWQNGLQLCGSVGTELHQESAEGEFWKGFRIWTLPNMGGPENPPKAGSGTVSYHCWQGESPNL